MMALLPYFPKVTKEVSFEHFWETRTSECVFFESTCMPWPNFVCIVCENYFDFDCFHMLNKMAKDGNFESVPHVH